MDENLGAVNVECTPNELAEIALLLSAIEVEGARLPQAALEMTGI
jgi:hypothetical protein